MRQKTFSTPRSEVGRSRRVTAAPRRRRLLRTAVLLSVGVHLAVAALIVLLPRVMPQEARPQEQGTVELLMVEQKGAQSSPRAQPDDGKPAPERPEKEATKPAEVAVPEARAAPATPIPGNGDEPVPLPAEPPAPAPPTARPDDRLAANQTEARPVPRPAQEAPVFDLEGTESESNAIVLGGNVLPAMPDNRFRNRPPVYPLEAEIRGDHGSVVVSIHVSENGVATGADVIESSGVPLLDQAAVTAVRKWHFHPAMKAGRTVPFDMAFRFIFQAD
jgi:protein TonB